MGRDGRQPCVPCPRGRHATHRSGHSRTQPPLLDGLGRPPRRRVHIQIQLGTTPWGCHQLRHWHAAPVLLRRAPPLHYWHGPMYSRASVSGRLIVRIGRRVGAAFGWSFVVTLASFTSLRDQQDQSCHLDSCVAMSSSYAIHRNRLLVTHLLVERRPVEASQTKGLGVAATATDTYGRTRTRRGRPPPTGQRQYPAWGGGIINDAWA